MMSSSSILSSSSVDDLYRKWCLAGATPSLSTAQQYSQPRTASAALATAMMSPRALESTSSLSSHRFSTSPTTSLHRGEVAAANRALLDRIQSLEDRSSTMLRHDGTPGLGKGAIERTQSSSGRGDGWALHQEDFGGQSGRRGGAENVDTMYNHPSTNNNTRSGESGIAADLAQQLLGVHEENHRLRQRVEEAYRAADSRESEALLQLREKHRQAELRWVQESEYLRQRARTYEAAANDAKSTLALTQSRVEQLKAVLAKQEAAADVRERELLATVAAMERDLTSLRLASSRDARKEQRMQAFHGNQVLLSPADCDVNAQRAARDGEAQQRRMPLSPDWAAATTDGTPRCSPSARFDHSDEADTTEVESVHRALHSVDPERLVESLAACLLPPSSSTAAQPTADSSVRLPPTRDGTVEEASCSSGPNHTCPQCMLAHARLDRAREELLESTTQWGCVAEEVAAFAAAVLEGARRSAQEASASLA